jgi:hypothetical protein
LQQQILLLKMDTEGAELSALQGLTALLEARQVCSAFFYRSAARFASSVALMERL